MGTILVGDNCSSCGGAKPPGIRIPITTIIVAITMPAVTVTLATVVAVPAMPAPFGPAVLAPTAAIAGKVYFRLTFMVDEALRYCIRQKRSSVCA